MSSNLFFNYPNDFIISIFKFLEPSQLAQCCAVDRKFRTLGCQDLLWKGNFPSVTFPVGISCKAFIDAHAVISKEQLLLKVGAFADRLELHHVGIFNCQFPLNPGCIVKVVCGYGKMSIDELNEDIPPVKSIMDSCIFAKKILVSPQDLPLKQAYSSKSDFSQTPEINYALNRRISYQGLTHDEIAKLDNDIKTLCTEKLTILQMHSSMEYIVQQLDL